LDEAASSGMIEYLPTGMAVDAFVSNILPLGARAKPNGSVRMLVDPSLPGADSPSINACMQPLPCPLVSITDIFAAVKKHSVLGKRDLLNGFFHLVLSPSARRYMGLTHPVSGKIGRWVVLPQGTRQSPAFFCEVSNAACRIFNSEFQRIGLSAVVFVYVDDYVIIADSHADMQQAFAVMDSVAAELGLAWNPKKDVGREAPTTRLEALGLIIDAPSLTLHLPEDKRASYLAELQQFRRTYEASATCPRKPLERLLGKLIFTSKVCRWGFLFVQAIMDELYPGTSPPGNSATLSDALWHDISFWEMALGSHYTTWMGIRQQQVHTVLGTAICSSDTDLDIELFSDASKSFGVGGILGTEVLSMPWGKDVSSVHIGALELEALHQCLHNWRHRLAGSRVLCWVDNVQALVAVNKGASRLPPLRDTLLKIALLGLEYNFDVRARHIQGIMNPADAPSRGDASGPALDWTFQHASEFNQPPAEIDCCAAPDGSNALASCTKWLTAHALPEHTQDLVGKVMWAAIPFSLLSPCLSAIVAAWQQDPAHTIATVVVPEWPTASWYTRYLRRKTPLFRVLHRYEAGSRIFNFRNGQPAPATPYPVLVLRLGGPML
jgi:hypothetical protein